MFELPIHCCANCSLQPNGFGVNKGYILYSFRPLKFGKKGHRLKNTKRILL